MRKFISMVLGALLLTSIISPAFASGYRETAIAYLMEKYDASEERIELYEGETMKLEFTGESFWFAKYGIIPEGGTSPATKEGSLPADSPEGQREPATDIMPSVLPEPPQDGADDGHIYGGVYIHTNTGQIYELEEMEPFFTAEHRLAEQEWERLRKEAGKLDVPLYQKLQKVSSTEKVSVWIEAAAVETKSVIALFEALQKKYPEQSAGMNLKDFLFPGFGYAVPEARAESVPVSAGNSPANDEAVSYMVPDNELVRPLPADQPDSAVIDDEYWQMNNAFWQELEAIRINALAPSLANIKVALDGMGVSYRDNGPNLAADLTAAQIREIAELPDVAMIFEEAIFTTMDAELMARSGAAEEKAAAAPTVESVKNTPAYTILLTMTALLLTGVFLFFRRRINQQR